MLAGFDRVLVVLGAILCVGGMIVISHVLSPGCNRRVGLIVQMLSERHCDDEFVIREDRAFRLAFLREVDDVHRSEPGQLFVNILYIALGEVCDLANTLGFGVGDGA